MRFPCPFDPRRRTLKARSSGTRVAGGLPLHHGTVDVFTGMQQVLDDGRWEWSAKNSASPNTLFMKSTYYPPLYGKDQFHCILCNVYARQVFCAMYIQGNNLGETWLKSDFWASKCTHCGKWTFWHLSRMIVPSEAPVEPPHQDLPEDCRADYVEARDVFSRSPRAAAALLRLCIQKLLPHLGETGKNINDDIKELVQKGLPPLVQKALDYCRVVGNNAVHPGEIDLNDSPEIAAKLFQMINFIVDDRITRPKEIADLYSELPTGALTAIEKRDQVRES